MRGEPRAITSIALSDNTPQIRSRVPPINTDFITMVNRKAPYLTEPVSLITRVLNLIITNLNLRSLYHHTIKLDNLAPDTNVCVPVPMRVTGTTLVISTVLRYAIASSLIVKINCTATSFNGVLASIVIPSTTKPFDLVIIRQKTNVKLDDMAVLSFDIVAGPTISSSTGIASLTLEWTQ